MLKTLKYSLLLFFVFTITVSVWAQPKTMVTYATKLKVADKAAKEGDYYSAIEWYEKAWEESRDPSLQIAMADLYVLARDYKRAERAYLRILRRDRDKVYEELRLDYANVFKKQGLYSEALAEYNTILANAELSDEIKEEARFELDGIEMMADLENNLEAIISFVPGKVNSGSAESSPAIGPDGSLYFSSFNTRKAIILDGEEGDYHAKLYSSKMNKEGEFDKSTALGDHINREGFHSGGVSFSKDGRTMYFTRATLTGNGITTSQIYSSNQKGRIWEPPTILANVNGNFASKHPIVGELFGRNVLFFTSNMEGGSGGYDIYYSEISNGEYGLPVNLGPTINTEGDEISPFYQDGTLYFSSEGYKGIGGYDIFYSTWNGSNWSDVTNLGFQYNTAYDDMFLRFDPSGTTGYLVSNRPSKEKVKMKGNATCCDDIYSIYLKDLVIDFLAIVNDEAGPLAGASIELYDLTLGGYPNSKTNVNTNEFNFGLDPERNFKALITKEGYYPDSVSFNTVGILDDYTVKKTITLKQMPKDEIVEVINANEPIKLSNIYYALDKYDILEEAEEDLTYLMGLMDDYPDMVIELSSHTDAQGEAPYNQRLSQQRAQSAKNWLVAEGIEENRIKPVGYGESIIINHCKNGVRCSDEEHKQNRRTEFKIIAGPQVIEIRKKSDRTTGPIEGTGVQTQAPSSAPATPASQVTQPVTPPQQVVKEEVAPTQVEVEQDTKAEEPAPPPTPRAERPVDPKKEAARKKAEAKREKANAARAAKRKKQEEERAKKKAKADKKRAKQRKKSGKQSFGYDTVPVISFDDNHFDVGVIKKGELKEIVFTFTNTGDADLIIDLATACKCTKIEYPTEPIPVGEKGEIRALFDSSDQDLGHLTKTIDIIANTKPIVVEAKFSATIEE